MTKGLLIDKTLPKTQAGFIRVDGHSLDEGVIVEYRLSGWDYRVRVSRIGISIAGTFPTVNRLGIQAVIGVLLRAIRHHEHLAAFADGDRQVSLPEEIVEAEETAQHLVHRVTPPSEVM